MRKNICLIQCKCKGKALSEEKSKSISAELMAFDVDFFEVEDICAFAVSEKERLIDILDQYNMVLIIACFPRAVQNIFKQANIQNDNFKVLNLREFTPQGIKTDLIDKFKISVGEANHTLLKTSLEVPAWYPVIDQTRCILCGQCASFCMFGVYRFDKNSLQVVNPLSCKNLCPACGRTCPSSAIIFPRLEENSVLSGDEPKEENLKEKKEEGNLFVMLKDRNQKRPSIFSQNVVKIAEEERQKALDELKSKNFLN